MLKNQASQLDFFTGVYPKQWVVCSTPHALRPDALSPRTRSPSALTPYALSPNGLRNIIKIKHQSLNFKNSISNIIHQGDQTCPRTFYQTIHFHLAHQD